MRLKKLQKKYFNKGNVCVTGLRGTGKDLLFANIICRSKKTYISNLDYTNGKNYTKLNFSNLNLSENSYKDLLNGTLKPYSFTDFYVLGSDIYLSDAGVYFPSQYCNELNRDYKHFPMYMALSRQVSHNNFHINVQNLNRCWDKIREQSDTYITCNWSFYLKLSKIPILGNLFQLKDRVIQRITIYDKYQSCVDRVRKPRIRVPLFDKNAKTQAKIYLDNHRTQFGTIKNKLLFYKNKSTYDTLYFEKLFKEVKKYE